MGNCRPWGCGTPTHELKMSCWCKIFHKRLIHLHTLYYTMTAKKRAQKMDRDARDALIRHYLVLAYALTQGLK